MVALYPLSSPNHNYGAYRGIRGSLRYILFHHQTTTCLLLLYCSKRCVISSFITKPQLSPAGRCSSVVALYPLSSPNHNFLLIGFLLGMVALYPLSSPNHNKKGCVLQIGGVALYPLSSPNHNLLGSTNNLNLLRYILFHHQTTTCIPYVL